MEGIQGRADTEPGNVTGIKRHDERETGVLTGSRKEGSLTQRDSGKEGSTRGNTFRNWSRTSPEKEDGEGQRDRESV